MDDDNGPPGDNAPQPGAFQAEEGGQHLEAHERQNGQKPREHGAVRFLNGEGGDIGNEDGDDQLRGLKLPDLAFAHQPDAEHHHKIQDHRPQKCDQHKKSPRMEGIIYGFGRHIPAHIPAAAANNEKEFPRQGK